MRTRRKPASYNKMRTWLCASPYARAGYADLVRTRAVKSCRHMCRHAGWAGAIWMDRLHIWSCFLKHTKMARRLHLSLQSSLWLTTETLSSFCILISRSVNYCSQRSAVSVVCGFFVSLMSQESKDLVLSQWAKILWQCLLLMLQQKKTCPVITRCRVNWKLCFAALNILDTNNEAKRNWCFIYTRSPRTQLCCESE